MTIFVVLMAELLEAIRMPQENRPEGNQEQSEESRAAFNQERPEAEERRRSIEEVLERLRRLPVLDDRSPDEIIGYDEHGLPI